ncbi:MAG: hypothetical protein ACSHX3_16915 [Litorimonas sp.]
MRHPANFRFLLIFPITAPASGMAARLGEHRLRASALPTARPEGRRQSASPTPLEPHPETEVRGDTTARL